MKKLFAPWREEYSQKVTAEKKEDIEPEKCIFCSQIKGNQDNKNFILKRFKHSFVILNKYPYNAGHILVLPIRHVQKLSQLSKEEKVEIMEIISKSTDILSNTLKNDGMNLGINLGKAAGAGIPSHLHIHLLPRWEGDTNFMPTLGETKVISFDLDEIYNKLKVEFKEIDFK